MFSPATAAWFAEAFDEPTPAQDQGWAAIERGEHTLILAPTGSGKTLAAFLWTLDRLLHAPVPAREDRCRVLYLSPLKALTYDVERNLRAPLAGIAHVGQRLGLALSPVTVASRTGDTPAGDRRAMARNPPDVLVTTPESLYLILTSEARRMLASVEYVIVDEIHAVAGTKRGAHLALSLERLEELCRRPPQRIGLSATQRPLDELARWLGGAAPSAGPAAGPAVGSAAGPAGPAVGSAGPAGSAAGPAVGSAGPAGPAVEPAVGSAGPGVAAAGNFVPRPVTLVDAGVRKPLELQIVVPVEDMGELGRPLDEMRGAAAGDPEVRASIWPAIHPVLLDLIRSHRSTLIFVNSRRLAERLAARLNELAAGETQLTSGASSYLGAGVVPELVRAHHGSIAREQRLEIEDALKAGRLPGLVATSSLELGIDMGAIDLVIQVEAPPSVASGLQRIGRAGHSVGMASRGRIFPKFRHDLLLAAVVVRRMHAAQIEATEVPRNPLDVLAQQIVAHVAAADAPVPVEEVAALAARAYPFATLTREALEGVLDMLAGRYPSDEFAELRPRIVWDRLAGTLVPRAGARMLAVTSGGTIPDRGLFGVFTPEGGRVGELDEEMVYESRVGETFLLGATTWRIEEISRDRVIVTPAPGIPGKMPFWHGDGLGRPFELGAAVGQFCREVEGWDDERLGRECDLDALGVRNLRAYLDEERAATGGLVPTDRQLVVERFRDELGDWRIALLSPFGARVHAPWALAIEAVIRDRMGLEVQAIWSDDGIVLRLPEAEEAPPVDVLLIDPDEIEDLVVGEVGRSPVFASRFRENAARALLLPRRRPGSRTPLWQQRQRAADLLAVASRYGSFPILLETYRECLREVFDLPALIGLLADIRARRIRVAAVDTAVPSPFASSLAFAYVATFMYEGDAPVAERRAQALTLDRRMLAELVGSDELRDLLDAGALQAIEAELQCLDERRWATSVDGAADLLRRLGDLTVEELAARCQPGCGQAWSRELLAARRALTVRIAGQDRLIAAEDAGRYRDALGVVVPPGVPEAFLAPVPDALLSLVRRWARVHGPFTLGEPAARFGVPVATLEPVAGALVQQGRLERGGFRPGGTGTEWLDVEVLRLARQRSLAVLRREVEPAEAAALARFVPAWQGVGSTSTGLDRLYEVVAQLQGFPVPASLLERDVLATRVRDYRPAMLDELMAAGEVMWIGAGSIGRDDGRIALLLRDTAPLLAGRLGLVAPPAPAGLGGPPAPAGLGGPPAPAGLGGPPATAGLGGPPATAGFTDPTGAAPSSGRLHDHLRAVLAARGACFFRELGLPGVGDAELLEALWDLVWAGEVTNDSLAPLRAGAGRRSGQGGRRPGRRSAGRPRLGTLTALGPPRGAGRWSLVSRELGPFSVDPTAASVAVAGVLLERHGMLTREAVRGEGIPGGFAGLYPVLRAMEESGRIRRGYFVAGLGGAQFALPGAVDRLRSFRTPAGDGAAPEVAVLAATDPANVYGLSVPWPVRGPQRAAGAGVVTVDGVASLYLERGGKGLIALREVDGAWEGPAVEALVRTLATSGSKSHFVLDRLPPELVPMLRDAGFVDTPKGLVRYA